MSTNYYEHTFIISPVLEDDQYSGIIKKYTDLIEEKGGDIDEVDEWGIRKFEYEMDGKSSGFYVNAYFHAPGELIADLERTQLIDDDILRFLTLKYDAKMLRHRDLQKKNAVPDIFEQDGEDENEEEDDD